MMEGEKVQALAHTSTSTLMRQRLQEMSREELEIELSNRVYEAARLIEQLEHVGLVLGNGHHAAQSIAEFAVKELKSRWK